MTIDVTLTAPFSDTDKRGARRRIGRHNAAQPADDDGNPNNQMPSDTDAELKAGYELLLIADNEAHHAHEVDLASREAYALDAKALWREASPAQRTAAIAALQA